MVRETLDHIIESETIADRRQSGQHPFDQREILGRVDAQAMARQIARQVIHANAGRRVCRRK